MRNGIIIQIKGLGVPVQAPSQRNQEGYEIRWSSDPEVPENAPTHVLIGSTELQRFLELAVDRRFVVADLIQLTQVLVPDDRNSLTRIEAVAAGIHPDNWNTVRVALVISGNAARGPVMDEIEWIGTRDEYFEGTHLREAFDHAQRRGIKSPSIFPHTESGHILRAAEFLGEFRRQMKPSLRAAETMTHVLEENLCGLDLTNINPDRAAHYLREIQRAFIAHRDQQFMELEDTGRIEGQMKHKAKAELDELNEISTQRISKGPRLH